MVFSFENGDPVARPVSKVGDLTQISLLPKRSDTGSVPGASLNFSGGFSMRSWTAVPRTLRFASAIAAVALLGACADSNTAASVGGPSEPEVRGLALTSLPSAGKVVACIVGTTSSFNVTTSLVGSSIASGITTITTGGSVSVAGNNCEEVATQSGVGGFTTFAVSLNLTGGATLSSVTCIDQIKDGDATASPPVPAVAYDCSGPSVDLTANGFHGSIVTFTVRPAVTGCTFTQGYWKNHEETAQPLFSLANGGNVLIDIGRNGISGDADDRTATFLNYQALMRESSKDYQFALIQQLIAAELNLRNSATASTAVLQAMTAARVLLVGGVSVAEKSDASRLNNILTTFNEGNALNSSRHCDR